MPSPGELGREVGVHVRDPRLLELREQVVGHELPVERLGLADEDVRVRRRRNLGDERVPEILEALLVERPELVARAADQRIVRPREDVEVPAGDDSFVLPERPDDRREIRGLLAPLVHARVGRAREVVRDRVDVDPRADADRGPPDAEEADLRITRVHLVPVHRAGDVGRQRRRSATSGSGSARCRRSRPSGR